MFWQTTRFRIALTRPQVMGIVNVTPDSFSDGGRHDDAGRALAHCEKLLAEGADILDIGGESTRPGAAPVPLDAELRRVLPVLEGALKFGVPLSVDTVKPEVMRRALECGADIVNDINALRLPGAEEAVAAHPGCGVCLMHMRGDPATMQQRPAYDDVVTEVSEFLRERMKAIQHELGEDDEASEVDKLRAKIEAAQLPEDAQKVAERELGRLAKLNPASPEFGVARTYLETIADLPWSKRAPSVDDLDKVAAQLDADHHGLDEVKERILEFLAVRKLRPGHQGSILCFSGPPGVGKTSLGRSIARAMFLGAFGALLGLGSSCTPLDTATLVAPEVISSSYGGKPYRLYVPSGYRSGTPVPLVLMLHGCLQGAAQFAQTTRMDALAESENFLALYPEQTTSANPAQCWLWYDPANQERGRGEPAFFVEIGRAHV
mgnify:CR=1 FL=1